jgi:hypothetical protein
MLDFRTNTLLIDNSLRCDSDIRTQRPLHEVHAIHIPPTVIAQYFEISVQFY